MKESLMVQPMLLVHWKQARLPLIPFVVAAFGLPLLLVQGFGGTGMDQTVSLDAYRMLAAYQVWLPYFPLLAGSIGAVIALTAWHWDHRYGHVYALSLPVARWQYTMMKMGAGAALVLLPAAALWVGAQLASSSVTLPEGLRAYPNHLAFRFFLASLVSYSVFFALAAGTIRTTVWVVSAVLAVFLGAGLIETALAYYGPGLEDTNLVLALTGWLLRARGPLAVFTGNWALIDV
jgi:hypothetical protein